jgi:hypothetical protein
MSLITLFSAPKPFVDPHINIIQRNALGSWLQLAPDVEVLLIGDEEGMSEVAAEYGVEHLPQVVCSASGTPLISSIFQLARQHSDSPLLAYVNADILLLPDFVEMSRRVMRQADEFLLVGKRWDLDVTVPLAFGPRFAEQLRIDVRARGRLHPPAGSDYFIYPRGLFTKIPDFAVGRAGWDNWMLYHAAAQPWPLIDATRSILVIHQNHDYTHLAGGVIHYDHEETLHNVELAGGEDHMYMLLDTQKELMNGTIRPPRFQLVRLVRGLERRLLPYVSQKRGWRWQITRKLRRWRRKMLHTREDE